MRRRACMMRTSAWRQPMRCAPEQCMVCMAAHCWCWCSKPLRGARRWTLEQRVSAWRQGHPDAALEAATCSLGPRVRARAQERCEQPSTGPDACVAQALEEDVARLGRANASLAEDLQRARRRGACHACLGAGFVSAACHCIRA